MTKSAAFVQQILQSDEISLDHIFMHMHTVKILNFRTDTLGQSVQTLEEQSDQGLHCLLFHLHHLEVLHHSKTF